MTLKKSLGEQLAEKTFREMGYDPKTKTFRKEVGENRSGLGDSKRNRSLNSSYPSPNSSYHLAQPKAGIRIKALEKTFYQSPTGTTYRYSPLYRNAIVLQLLIEKFTSGLDSRMHHRLITQVNDAARSVVANIAEGYSRPTSVEYIKFLGFSKASLEEIITDIIHAKDTELLQSNPGSSLHSIGIILKPNAPPKPSYSSPQSYYDPLGEVKRIIRDIRREVLTLEIFIELANKTSYLFKRTVEGLWQKLTSQEQENLRNELNSLWKWR